MADGAEDLKAARKVAAHQQDEQEKEDKAEREAQPHAGGDLYPDQIYDVMRNNVPGSGPVHQAAASAKDVHGAMDRAIDSINRAKSVIESSMQGTAASSASGSMKPMVSKLSEKQNAVKTWGDSVNSQAHAYDTRAPKLEAVSKGGPGFWDRLGGCAPWVDDSINNDKGMWQDACRKNVDLFNAYHGDATSNSPGLSGNPPPPPNTSRNKEVYNPANAPGHGSSSAPPQTGPGGSGGHNGPGAPGVPGGPGGWQTPHSPLPGVPGGSDGPNTSGQGGPNYPGGHGGNPYTPVNPATTSAAALDGAPGAGGLGAGGNAGNGGAGHGGAGAGAAGGMPMGGMPMGGMGGGMGGDIERSGRGFGGGMRGAGQGAAGSGMGGARSGAGGLAGEGGLGGRGAAGSAGGAGGRGGGAPMGGGRGAKGEDDAEHQTASYLVNEDNGSEIVGDLPLTAPPVIGE